MKFPRLNFETFGSIGAIIVSLAALFVAWDQAVVMRQQQHAAVWPFATADVNVNQTEDHNYMEVSLSNPGVGPAIVRSGHILVDGEPVDRLNRLLDELLPTGLRGDIQVTSESAIGILGAGETRSILRLTWNRSEENDAQFAAYIDRALNGDATFMGLEVCYCSVFDRCWVNSSVQQLHPDGPERVEACESSGDFLATFFLSDEAAPTEDANEDQDQ